MTRKKFTFASENLVVDYMAFKFKDLKLLRSLFAEHLSPN